MSLADWAFAFDDSCCLRLVAVTTTVTLGATELQKQPYPQGQGYLRE
jgi:hypothetical protein